MLAVCSAGDKRGGECCAEHVGCGSEGGSMIWGERRAVDDDRVDATWRGSCAGEDVGEAGECHLDGGLYRCLKWW